MMTFIITAVPWTRRTSHPTRLYDTFRSSGQLTMSCSGTHRDTAVFDPTQVLDTGLKSARFYHWQAASAERQHAAQLAQLLYTALTCCQHAADFFGVLGGGRIRK